MSTEPENQFSGIIDPEAKDLGSARTEGGDMQHVPAKIERGQIRHMAGNEQEQAANDLRLFVDKQKFATVLADPPWRFANRTGKVAPEHKRLSRYGTMDLDSICALPVADVLCPTAHLYLWVPNALLPQGIAVLNAWGFEYKSNIVWHKLRKDGGSDGRGVGFYFRNVTELMLFGVRGKNCRTLQPGRTQVNYIGTRKREHSRKPDEQYDLIESCSSGPYLELFARGTRRNWASWGDQADEGYEPTWNTYARNSSNDSDGAAVLGGIEGDNLTQLTDI
jgi:N6-adenosine-specific RNA methylase IME4